MGFFDFLKQNNTEQVTLDFSSLGVDMHSHLWIKNVRGIDSPYY